LADNDGMKMHDAGSVSLLEARLWRHQAFRDGLRDMARVMPGIVAWGLVTGVAMVKGGMPLPIALLMALTVFAASAQLAAVPLMLAGAPVWVIWLTASCVNLRFVIFSAQMRRHMLTMPLRWRLVAGYLTADLTYVLMQQRYGDDEPASPSFPDPLAYMLGLSVVNWGAWNISAVTGVLFASAIPTEWGMGFAGTLALVALLVSLVRDRLTAITAGLAGTAAVAAFGLPFKLHIVVAVAAAVAAGLLMEQAAALRVGRAGRAAGEGAR
jgi:predicted branched-subunit amino acid permease